MKKRTMKTKVLSYLLTLVMLMSSTMTVMAEGDPTVSGNQQTIIEEVDETGEADSSVSENDSDMTEETEEVSMEETTEATDVSANDQEEEDLFPGLPETYTFSAQELESKKALQTELANLGDLREGTDYVAKEVMFLCDTEEEAQLYAAAFGATLESYFDGVGVITLPEKATVYQAVSAASKEENRLPAVEPNYYRYALDTEEEILSEENYSVSAAAYNDPYLQPTAADYQWHHAVVGSTYAWGAGYTGKGVKVAVLDTGVAAHPDLTIADSYNALTGSTADTADENNHGTHVSGIICAKNNNGIGGSGIAPDATLYNVRVLDDDSSASGTSATLVRGLNKAVSWGVDIINMSLGGMGYSTAESNAVTNATKNGAAVFVAAGNDSAGSKMFPAAYKDSICVAALDEKNTKAYFSNYGSWVQFSAPGVNIYSTVRNNQYAYMSGTSQATPVVAGTAAVILSSNHPGLKDKSGKTLTGVAKVNALKKIMGANTVKASGKQLGKGIPNLAKVFQLSTAAGTPNAPAFYADGVLAAKGGTYTKENITVTLKAEGGMTIYYTTDGSNPSYKNGVATGSTYAAGFKVDGFVKGKPTGKVTVKAIAVNAAGKSSKVAQATFVLKPLVGSIQISGLKQVVPGKSISLQASVTPAWAANKAVTWSISGTPKTTGVSINAKGVVTASKKAVAGTYTITAQAKDKGAKKATYTITVLAAPKIDKIAFTTKSVPAIEKTGSAIKDMSSLLEVKDSNGKVLSNSGNVLWSVNNTAVATINQTTGVLTAQSAGTVTVTATAADGSGKKASIKLTVIQMPESISFTAESKHITVLAAGKSVTLKAEVGPANTKNKTITWSITEDPAATGVSVKNGKVTAKKTAQAGTYTVTAKTVNGKAVTQRISVVASSVTKITMASKSVDIFRTPGTSGAPTSTKVPVSMEGSSNYAALSVTSSAPGIATASLNGSTLEVKAAGGAAGKATITVAATDGSGKKATLTVNVKNPASKMYLSLPDGRNDAIGQGKTLKLEVSFQTEYGAIDASSKKVIWSSRDPRICTVDSKGVITAKGDPTEWTVITATAADGSGLQASYRIYVDSAITHLGVGSTIYSNTYAVEKWNPYERVFGYPIYMGNTRDYRSALFYPDFQVEVAQKDVATAAVKYRDDGTVYLQIYLLKKGNVDVTIKTMNGTNLKAKIKLFII